MGQCLWDGRMEHWGECVRANIGNLGEEYERDKELGEGKWLRGQGEGGEGGKGEAGGFWVVARALEGRQCQMALTANPCACALVCV